MGHSALPRSTALPFASSGRLSEGHPRAPESEKLALRARDENPPDARPPRGPALGGRPNGTARKGETRLKKEGTVGTGYDDKQTIQKSILGPFPAQIGMGGKLTPLSSAPFGACVGLDGPLAHTRSLPLSSSSLSHQTSKTKRNEYAPVIAQERNAGAREAPFGVTMCAKRTRNERGGPSRSEAKGA